MMQPRIAATLIALFFLLLGLPFLAKTGIHVDASYELSCFYPCGTPKFSGTVFGSPAPLMVMEYLGTFKAWVYRPVLNFFDATPLILRLPTLAFGAASVWMFFFILHRVRGSRAAVAGSLLLATDAGFLIATAYDFGPIALLHCLMLAGILLLLRFDATRSLPYLALAFFLFGLALWHKALFVWMIVGLAAAALIVFPGRIRQLLSPLRLGTAAIAFCLGASPLLYFNLVSGGATLRIEKVISAETPISQKARILKRTMDGSVLFGFLTDESGAAADATPGTIKGRLSVWIDKAARHPHSNWMAYALLISVCLIPWLWFTPARRPILFALVYLVVVWLQMALQPKTGAAVHHAILLWPFPHFLIAAAGDQIYQYLQKRGRARPLLAVFCLLIVSNGLLINAYYARLITRGPTAIWSDAIYPLTDYLQSAKGYKFFGIDWGYTATLCLLSKGTLPVNDISQNLWNPGQADTALVGHLISTPGNVFIGHSDGAEQFAGVHARLDSIAAGLGFEKEVLKVIPDRHQRPRFTVCRYTKPDIGEEPVFQTAASPPPAAVAAGNRAHEEHMAGFHQIEFDAWRWTKRNFAVRLRAPSGGPLKMTADLHVPPLAIERLGAITLTPMAGSKVLESATYSQPGDYTLTRPLPPGGASEVLIRFSLDKYFRAGDLDERELGIIVKSVSLSPIGR